MCVCLCVVGFQVVWCNGELRSLQQAHSGLRDGHEGQGERLPPGLLRVPALQSEVSDWTTPLLLSRTCVSHSVRAC